VVRQTIADISLKCGHSDCVNRTGCVLFMGALLESHKQFRPVLMPAVEGETLVLQCTDYLVEVASEEYPVPPS